MNIVYTSSLSIHLLCIQLYNDINFVTPFVWNFKHSRVFKPGSLPSPGQNHHRHLLSSTCFAAAAGGSKFCGERNLEILEIFEEKSWWKLFVVATRKRRSAFLFVVKDLFSGCLLLVLGSVTRLSTWCFQRFSQFYPEIRGNDPIWLAHIFQMSWNHLVFCCGHQVSKWHSASTRLIDKDAWILLGFFTFRPQLGFDWCLKGAVLFTSLLWQPPCLAIFFSQFGWFRFCREKPLSSCSGQDCGWLLDVTSWNKMTPLLGFELFLKDMVVKFLKWLL